MPVHTSPAKEKYPVITSQAAPNNPPMPVHTSPAKEKYPVTVSQAAPNNPPMPVHTSPAKEKYPVTVSHTPPNSADKLNPSSPKLKNPVTVSHILLRVSVKLKFANQSAMPPKKFEIPSQALPINSFRLSNPIIAAMPAIAAPIARNGADIGKSIVAPIAAINVPTPTNNPTSISSQLGNIFPTKLLNASPKNSLIFGPILSIALEIGPPSPNKSPNKPLTPSSAFPNNASINPKFFQFETKSLIKPNISFKPFLNPSLLRSSVKEVPKSPTIVPRFSNNPLSKNAFAILALISFILSSNVVRVELISSRFACSSCAALNSALPSFCICVAASSIPAIVGLD